MAAAATSIIPIIASRNLPKMSPLQKPVQAWIESLNQVEDKKIGMIDLHPSIFKVNPRLDILARNVYWQQMYGKIVSELKSLTNIIELTENYEL
jgi:large subunit ribosomal protein L4